MHGIHVVSNTGVREHHNSILEKSIFHRLSEAGRHSRHTTVFQYINATREVVLRTVNGEKVWVDGRRAGPELRFIRGQPNLGGVVGEVVHCWRRDSRDTHDVRRSGGYTVAGYHFLRRLASPFGHGGPRY